MLPLLSGPNFWCDLTEKAFNRLWLRKARLTEPYNPLTFIRAVDSIRRAKLRIMYFFAELPHVSQILSE